MGKKRRYEAWQGRNQFECGGRLVHGPDRIYFWCSAGGIIIGGILYWTVVIPEIMEGAELNEYWSIIHAPLFGAIWLLTILMHMIVAYMDPGVIPRKTPPKLDTEDPYLAALRAPAAQKVKWCPTCNVYRPPRTIHCGTCNCCIARFDHHCPYIGNCVGQRNYRFFLMFIFGTLLTALWVLSHCVAFLGVRIHRLGWDLGFRLNEGAFIVAFIVAALAFAATIMVGALVCWTSYLITNGRTTYEKIKLEKQFTPNPFDRGVLRNWFYVCCPPQYPSYLRPREIIEEL